MWLKSETKSETRTFNNEKDNPHVKLQQRQIERATKRVTMLQNPQVQQVEIFLSMPFAKGDSKQQEPMFPVKVKKLKEKKLNDQRCFERNHVLRDSL